MFVYVYMIIYVYTYIYIYIYFFFSPGTICLCYYYSTYLSYSLCLYYIHTYIYYIFTLYIYLSNWLYTHDHVAVIYNSLLYTDMICFCVPELIDGRRVTWLSFVSCCHAGHLRLRWSSVCSLIERYKPTIERSRFSSRNIGERMGGVVLAETRVTYKDLAE